MNIRNNKTVDIRSIKRHNKDGTITTITNDYKVIGVRSAVDCNDITAISLVVEEK